MISIKEEEEAQSISLYSDSVIHENDLIQQYGNLEFSDENSDERENNSSYETELSAEKLRFLGVDKFPGHYGKKIKDISDTQAGISEYIKPISESGYDSFSSKKRRKPRRPDQVEKSRSFNIDSFLNTEHQIIKKQPQIEIASRKFSKGESDKSIKDLQLKKAQQFERKQQIKKEGERRNAEVRQFIKKYERKHKIFQKQVRQNQTDMSEPSISLITIPQPKLQIKKDQLEQKKPNAYYFSKGSRNQESLKQIREEKQFQLRFQESKIKFMDTFLPESLRLGNNPYNFWKYANSKNNYFKIR